MSKPERYRSPSICRDVEIGLDDFSDDEIRLEHEHRTGVATAAADPALGIEVENEPVLVAGVRLREIRKLQLSGRHSEAARAVDDLIRDALGTAI